MTPPVTEPKLSASQILDALQLQVKEAKTKQDAMAKAEAEFSKASSEYSAALTVVDRLKQELLDEIGSVFPSGAGKARQY